MAAFFVRRVIGAILVMIAVSFIVFVIFIVVPGGGPNGTAERIAGKNANDTLVANIKEKWGFDRPFYVQYWYMLSKAYQGIAGNPDSDKKLVSYTTQQDVVAQIVQGMPATFSLTIGAGLIWLGFGILVGTISAVTAGRLSDRLITILALIGISMPVFWLGIILRYYFAETNTWFPDGEYASLTGNPAQWVYHLLLPWFTLAVLYIGFYGRVLRGNILDTINEDFVRTARAKGLSRRRVLVKHVLRNSLIPVVTLFGLDFAAVLGGGAILTETVYDIHGVGWYAALAVGQLDLPPLIGVTLFGALFIVVFSTLVDLVYAVLDPRIRPT